jgi:hypothetical protein
MGWGNAVDKVAGILDGLFGLSPEQKKIKLKNKIDKLEREKNELQKKPASVDIAIKCERIDNDCNILRKELRNL